jgi:hypothetical protein
MPWELAHPTDARFKYWMSALSSCASSDTEHLQHNLNLVVFGGDKRGSSALLSLLRGMLQPDPASRLTLDQVATHDWFQLELAV